MALQQHTEPSRFNFTKAALSAVEPTDKQRWVYDSKVDGLAVCITPNNARTYYLAKRIGGRYRRVRIASATDATVEQARRRARALLGQIAEGRDPAEARRQQLAKQAGALTLKQAWADYRDNHLKVNCSPRTARDDGYVVNAIGDRLMARRMDSVTPQDIAAVHARIAERGAVFANHAVRFLKRLYNYAADELEYDGSNPAQTRQGRRKRRAGGNGNARTVQLAPERSRDRYVEPREMPRLLAAIADEPDPDIADFVKMLMFTAARRRNVQAMAWADIDFDREVWIVPAEQAKSDRAIVIPLCSQAVELLIARQAHLPQGTPWVFPVAKSKSGHLETPDKRWRSLRKRAGLEDVTMHDLRRTTGSWAATIGVSDAVRRLMLGHAASGDVNAIYSRIGVEAVRDGFQRTVDAMLNNEGSQP